MSATRVLMLLALVVLAGCGGDGAKAEPAAVPKGFKTDSTGRPTRSRIPRPGRRSRVRASSARRARRTPPASRRRRPPRTARGRRLARHRDRRRSRPTTRRGAATGRSRAKRTTSSTAPRRRGVIEARYLAVTGDDTTPVRVDRRARARREDGNQLGLHRCAPRRPISTGVRMQEVLDTFRLEVNVARDHPRRRRRAAGLRPLRAADRLGDGRAASDWSDGHDRRGRLPGPRRDRRGRRRGGCMAGGRGGLRGWAVLLGAALGPLIGIALVIAGDPRASLGDRARGARRAGRRRRRRRVAFSARSRGRRRRG